MTKLETMTQIASQMTVTDLKEQATKMFKSAEEYAGDVLNSLLNALELKVSEEEFINFCNSF